MKLTRLFTALAVACVLTVGAFAQSTYLPNAGKYGITGWAVNGQRVASQYNYYIPSTAASGLGAYSFPPSVIYQAVPKGSQGFVNPFNVNATVKVIDVVAANTETVAFNSNSCTTGGGVASVCTLSLAVANTHNSYVLRSGTCGLREALNDLGTNGGEVIVDQRFYDDGCTAATITGLTFSATTPPIATQLIHDISYGQDVWYSIQANTLSTISAPTTSANLTCATTAGLVCQSATTGGTWPNSAEYVGEFYVDALGQWSASSTTANLTPSASGTNVLQFNSPAAATGAVGWLPFGGTTYNSASYILPVTSANCTLSTAMTLYPVCAIGSNATITAPSTTGSLNPQAGGIAAAYNPNPLSHTTFSYQKSQRPGFPFQAHYGPFTTCGTLTAGQKCVLGTIPLPVGILNQIGTTLHVYGRFTNTPSTAGTATGASVYIGDITDNSSGAPKLVCSNTVATTTGTSAMSYRFDCVMTTNATGTTGTIMPDSWQFWNVAGAAGVLGGEQATGAITVDVLDWDTLFLVFLQTSGVENTTGPQLQDLHIEVISD